MNERFFDYISAPKHVIRELENINSSEDLQNLVKRKLNVFTFSVSGERYTSMKLLFAQPDNMSLAITNKVVDQEQIGLFARVETNDQEYDVMTPQLLIKNYKNKFYILNDSEVFVTPASEGFTVLTDNREFAFYRIQKGVPEVWLKKPQDFPLGLPVPA